MLARLIIQKSSFMLKPLASQASIRGFAKTSGTTAQTESLASLDPELYGLLQKEKERQFKGIELIASECLGSVFTNKYSEGLPGARYYGGNEFIDQMENLCRDRALSTYRLSASKWGVNVQPYSGSTANFAAYNGLIQPHDRIMGLDLPSGGHLTHGYYRPNKKISATSIYFESLPYRVNYGTGFIDYEQLERDALLFAPNLLICGGSAYPREWDYARLRQIADKTGSILLCDMAHISGLVAANLVNDPFEYCDVVTTTTHKSLRGPRAGMIFFKKEFESGINNSVFPSIQGGPHNNNIAGVACQLKQAASPEFKQYATQVLKNAQSLAQTLTKHGYTLVTGGTDNHLMLLDVRPQSLTGSKLETLCDACNITLNKNSVYGDASAMSPGGARLGTPAMTSRGLKEADFVQVGDYIDKAIKLCLEIQGQVGKKLPAFRAAVSKNSAVKELKAEVEQFSSQFFMPCISPESISK